MFLDSDWNHKNCLLVFSFGFEIKRWERCALFTFITQCFMLIAAQHHVYKDRWCLCFKDICGKVVLHIASGIVSSIFSFFGFHPFGSASLMVVGWALASSLVPMGFSSIDATLLNGMGVINNAWITKDTRVVFVISLWQIMFSISVSSREGSTCKELVSTSYNAPSIQEKLPSTSCHCVKWNTVETALNPTKIKTNRSLDWMNIKLVQNPV